MRGFGNWLLYEEQRQKDIPARAIKTPLPKVEQQTNYSCGPAALRAVFGFFKVGPNNEKDYMKLLNTNPEDGTTPENMTKLAKKFGLAVKAKNGFTIDELKRCLENRAPVICAMQAWGDKKTYSETDDGHYVVAIGYDDEHIYFEDPSINGGKRGFLPYAEFEKRWYDIDGHGHKCVKFGIALWKPGNEPSPKLDKAKRIE